MLDIRQRIKLVTIEQMKRGAIDAEVED